MPPRVVTGEPEVLVIGAAGEASEGIVDDAPAAIDEGEIVAFVAQRLLVGPANEPVLGEPEMIVVEAAQRERVAEPDDALARKIAVVLEVCGEDGAHAGGVLSRTTKATTAPADWPGMVAL